MTDNQINYTRIRTDAKLEDALDALFTLMAACGVGHIRWQPGTRGDRQARQALKQARVVLQKSKYRVEAAELATPAALERNKAQHHPFCECDSCVGESEASDVPYDEPS